MAGPAVTALPFVGRGKESAYIQAELEAGRSVVLTGIYGIGRTSLVQHVARQLARKWFFVFVNFDRDPGGVWRDLFAAIFSTAHHRLRGETKSVRWTRFRVSNQRLEDRRRHVVVLDNVARLTPRRLGFVRLVRERFQVIAIAEEFLPEEESTALCAALWARRPLALGHLSTAATVAFFEESSRRHLFGWGPGEVSGLARAVHGFPLGMREAIAAELRRRQAPAHGSTLFSEAD
jgi:hypothetical protein